MSEDEQESTWDEFVGNSKSFAGRIAAPITPMCGFAKGPANKEQLFEWAQSTDLECPNVFQFDVTQFVDLVKCSVLSKNIDSSPNPSTHRIWIKSQLAKCVELWEKILKADHLGVMNSQKGKFKDREDAVMPIARQLHCAYGVWCRVFSDDFDDGSMGAWEKFISELKMENEPLDCLQFEWNGVVLPRYLFRVSSESGTNGREVTDTFEANSIAAWFSLFAIYDTLRFLAAATCLLCAWNEDEDKHEFLSRLRGVRDEWVLHFNIAAQWYERSWFLDEIIYQLNLNLRLKVELSNVKDFEPLPDEPYQALGRETLFKWFMKSSLNLSEEDAWRARYMAHTGRSAESMSLCELEWAYSTLFKKAEQTFQLSKDQKESEKLDTLRREVQKTKIKATRVYEVMAEIIPGNVDSIKKAISKDKRVTLPQYRRDVVAYKTKQLFLSYDKFQFEKKKLFRPQ
jgi:hypothetical protein